MVPMNETPSMTREYATADSGKIVFSGDGIPESTRTEDVVADVWASMATWHLLRLFDWLLDFCWTTLVAHHLCP